MYYCRILIMLTFCSCFSVFAGINSTQEQIQLTHSRFDEPLTFNVTLPAGYIENTDKSYILMFDFHPHADSYLRGQHDWLSHNGEWPWLQTIIVTPAPGNRVGMLFDPSGKTTPLLDFFQQQLMPEIDKKYRTNGFRIMSGFRVNATLVLSTLINKPDMFDAYIATSPELKDDYAGILSTMQPKLLKLGDKPKFLLFSHGTNVKEGHQQASYTKLKSMLENYAPTTLEWHYRHFDKHYFMSLPLLSVITAIESIFDDIHNGLAPESEVPQQGLDAIVKHYKYLSEQKYGFYVSPKTSMFQLGAYQFKQSPHQGIKIFKEMIKRYPDDVDSHHYLANAFYEIGDYKQAVLHQNNAVKIADKMLTWHKNRHRNFLEKYKANISKAVVK